MKKCYIAGKIGNLPESIYKANFKRAEQEVIALGYEPVNPVKLPHNHGKTWREYMNEDLTELLKCDYVYAQKNWTDSRGARIEVMLAATNNKKKTLESIFWNGKGEITKSTLF